MTAYSDAIRAATPDEAVERGFASVQPDTKLAGIITRRDVRAILEAAADRPSFDMDAAVEAVARAWASIDGKADWFDKDKAGLMPRNNGTYQGYMIEAEELLKRSGLADALQHLHDESVRRDAERWREFCRQADAGLLPAALLDDAKYMGAGVLELHVDPAIQEQRQLRTIRAEKEASSRE